MQKTPGLIALMAGMAWIFFEGCVTNPDQMAWSTTYDLPALDSSTIRKGRLENLDDLKGIDNWRLGMPKSYYRYAYFNDIDYKSDTCHARAYVYNFHEDCRAILVFAGDTLFQITLDMHCRNVQALVRRLRDLYGEPNEKSFRYHIMEDSTVVYPPQPGHQVQTYIEDPRVIFDSLMGYAGAPLPLYKDNEMHVENFYERPWPISADLNAATTLVFYPDMMIEAAWKSKRSLKLHIFREASVKPYMDGGMPTHAVHVDYYARMVME